MITKTDIADWLVALSFVAIVVLLVALFVEEILGIAVLETLT